MNLVLRQYWKLVREEHFVQIFGKCDCKLLGSFGIPLVRVLLAGFVLNSFQLSVLHLYWEYEQFMVLEIHGSVSYSLNSVYAFKSYLNLQVEYIFSLTIGLYIFGIGFILGIHMFSAPTMQTCIFNSFWYWNLVAAGCHGDYLQAWANDPSPVVAIVVFLVCESLVSGAPRTSMTTACLQSFVF